MTVDLQSNPPLLPFDVSRVLEGGLPTEQLLDHELQQDAWYQDNIVDLQTQATTLTATVGSNTAAIQTEASTRAAADAAEASARQALDAKVDSNAATVETNRIASVDRDNALSADLTSLTSTVNGNQASVQSQLVTLSNNDTALAGQFDSLSTTVGGYTAAISSVQSSVNGVAIRYGIQGYINTTTGGFVFTGILRNDGTVEYDLEINSNVTIHGNLLVGGTVTTGKIGAQQVTAAATSKTTGRSSYASNNDANAWTDILTVVTTAVTGGGYNRIMAVMGLGLQSTSGNLSSVRWRLYSDREGDLTGSILPTGLATCDTTGSPFNGFSYEPGVSYPRGSVIYIQDDASTSDTIRLQAQNVRFSGTGGTMWIDRKVSLLVETQKR